jgi:predicted helicase
MISSQPLRAAAHSMTVMICSMSHEATGAFRSTSSGGLRPCELLSRTPQTGEAFDFAVFDEAHKTAGREGSNFAFALDDKNLSIRKRLFLTATPRHYNPLAKNKDGGAQLVFSMDKPEIYGPIAYRLPFSEAAKRGIISDYKVIISEVTSDMVNDELLRRGIVLVKGEEIKARQVANQIALKSAIEKYNVSKVFTFHSRVDAAKSFTSDGAAGISNHLQGFHCGHIEGAMPTAY